MSMVNRVLWHPGISRGARKLARTPSLSKKKKILLFFSIFFVFCVFCVIKKKTLGTNHILDVFLALLIFQNKKQIKNILNKQTLDFCLKKCY